MTVSTLHTIKRPLLLFFEYGNSFHHISRTHAGIIDHLVNRLTTNTRNHKANEKIRNCDQELLAPQDFPKIY